MGDFRIKAGEPLIPIMKITPAGKQSTQLPIIQWWQDKKGKNYNTCEKGIVIVSDFSFQLPVMVLLFFLVYVLPYASYVMNESILGLQRLCYNMTRYRAIQQEWFTACHLCERNWHLTCSTTVCIWLKEITLFVKYITFVILL